MRFDDPDEDFMDDGDYDGDYASLSIPDNLDDADGDEVSRRASHHTHPAQHEHKPGQGNPGYGHLGHRKHEFKGEGAHE